jgi:lactate dehydrogenase-like 2-hydroxyacid dehydrogenase
LNRPANRPSVVLTRRWPAPVESALAAEFAVEFNGADRVLAEQELCAVAARADALCPTVTDRISAKVIAAAGPSLKLIANYGVGFEHIDLAAARDRGIVVTNTPDVLTDATADLAMALILAVARRIVEGDSLLRQKAWSGWRPTDLLGTQVSGKVLGLVGYGRIGRALAQRANRGFGMRILVHSPRGNGGDDSVPVTVCDSLEELLQGADFVSLHCPSRPATRHLLDATRLRQMRPQAFLINTARGNIVDEVALVAALRDGHIAGAGLDVYEQEPLLAAHLASLPNTVLLPHLGSATLETRVAMGMRVLANLRAFFAGAVPPDLVTPDLGK